MALKTVESRVIRSPVSLNSESHNYLKLLLPPGLQICHVSSQISLLASPGLSAEGQQERMEGTGIVQCTPVGSVDHQVLQVRPSMATDVI